MSEWVSELAHFWQQACQQQNKKHSDLKNNYFLYNRVIRKVTLSFTTYPLYLSISGSICKVHRKFIQSEYEMVKTQHLMHEVYE